MPHIIVEYASKIIDDSQINSILQAVHQSVSDSGLFKASQIKTRAYPFSSFTNAGGSDPYIHIQARIKGGRDMDNKKQLGQVILSGLSGLQIPVSVITVEVIDMERESYAKYSAE